MYFFNRWEGSKNRYVTYHFEKEPELYFDAEIGALEAILACADVTSAPKD